MRLLDTQGRPRFGVFPDAVDVDLEGYVHRAPMGGRAGRFASWVGFKQFQYFGVLADSLVAGCALVHLRYAATAFVYAYEPGRGMLVERSLRLPLGLGAAMSASPAAGRSSLRSGRARITMEYDGAPRRKRIDVDLGPALRLRAELDETAAGFRPMSLCTRIGRSGWVYAHKVAGVPVTGSLAVGERQWDLAAQGAFGHHDFSAGYMRRETFWNWACLSGSVQGRAVGLNVSCGVNETSFSENCVWVDGQVFPVGGCRFDYDWDRPLRPWHVTSGDGAVDLEFRPEGQHTERLRLGVVASDFDQIFGRFSGVLRPPGEPALEVRDMVGFVEDQYAKW